MSQLNSNERLTTEEYLRQHAVIDGMGNIDGPFVPLSIAMITIQKALDHEMEHKPPSWIKKDDDYPLDLLLPEEIPEGYV